MADLVNDFLTREKEELGGLESEIIGSSEASEPFEIIKDSGESAGFEQSDPVDDKENDDFIGYTVPKQVNEVPEKIRKWREEQQERLAEKDRDEEKAKEELRAQAKKELEDWYKRHEETIAKTKSLNRNAELESVAEDNEIEPGTEWERIAKLCDFNQSSQAKSTKSCKDTSRMRSIILQLKQTPITTGNQ